MRVLRWVAWVVAGLGLVAGCTASTASLPSGAEVTPTEAPLMGAALYEQRCAVCHGEQGEGRGKVGTALRSPELLASASDEYLSAAIAKGRPGTTMSPWAQNGLSEAQIASLVAHIRGWQSGARVEPEKPVSGGDAARGRALYVQHCASCHGPQGIPGRDPALVGSAIGNPVFLEQASDAFIAYGIARGRSGTAMPAFGVEHGGALDARAIADLVAYMRTWPK